MIKQQISNLRSWVEFSSLVQVLFVLLTACTTVEQQSVQKINETDYKIVGKFHKMEYDEIVSIVEHHVGQRINFYVTSHGGTSEDLFLAMDSVYRHGNVHWYALNDCSSACAVMALSTKHAHGEFRLHSFYKHRAHKVIPAPEYNLLVLDKLRSYGYETDNFSYMFNSVETMQPFTLEDDKFTK